MGCVIQNMIQEALIHMDEYPQIDEDVKQGTNDFADDFSEYVDSVFAQRI